MSHPMDYYLLPPLLRWEDIPDPDETTNLLDADFPSDPTPVLYPEKLTGHDEADQEKSLALDSESVTIFQTENGDVSHPDSDPSKAQLNLNNPTILPTKVEVKLARKWQKNVILAQFSSNPATDTSTLSCVRGESSQKTDLNYHIKSDHVVEDANSEATVHTANAPSSRSVPLQVRPTPVTYVGRNAKNKTSAAGSSSVDFFFVSSQIPRTFDLIIAISTTTSPSVKFLRVYSEVWTPNNSNSTNQTFRRPGPRLIWEIAWYVSSCLVK